METRKLQRVGGGSFTVSVPKEWATEHQLEPRTEVHLYTHRDATVSGDSGT
jgi:phosphate uptake regulator